MSIAGAAQVWAVVPAGGRGARMGSAIAKQYLPLAGASVIEHTLLRLGSHPAIDGVVVALDASDPQWLAIAAELEQRLPVALHVVAGGAERADSVRNALRLLESIGSDRDWVMVHDAARPCLRHDDLDALLVALEQHPVGGLLGLPVVDTMKRCNAAGKVTDTVNRDGLWRAATPQMFRLGTLAAALDAARERGLAVTDDASAIELAGLAPHIVAGHADNIKITHPADLELAAMFLRRQQQEQVV